MKRLLGLIILLGLPYLTSAEPLERVTQIFKVGNHEFEIQLPKGFKLELMIPNLASPLTCTLARSLSTGA